jgi:hypothetical protein
VRDGLDGVVERATQARIAGLLDAESAECAAEPSAVVTFARAAGDEKVARVRGMLAGRDQAALTIDGMPHCWSIASWSAGTLAARAPVLWDVPSAFPDAPQGDVARVRIESGGKAIAGTRSSDGAWTVTGGQVEGTRLGGIAGSVRSLRIEDLADASKVPSSQQAVTSTVSAEFGGKTLTVRLLGERPGGSGERYARIEGGSKLPPGVIAVLSKSSAAGLVP